MESNQAKLARLQVEALEKVIGVLAIDKENDAFRPQVDQKFDVLGDIIKKVSDKMDEHNRWG